MTDKDPDARLWNAETGVEYTLVKRGYREPIDHFWFENNLEGTYTVTPTYIGFELASDALLYQLGYTHD